MNGIDRTEITDGTTITTITPESAKIAIGFIEKSRQSDCWARTEFGSVEGEIISVTNWYNYPAIEIKERLSEDKVNCVLSDDLAEKIGPSHSWTEPWEQKRVLISGKLHYDSESILKRVEAFDLEEISPEAVDLEEIRALDITDGLTPQEHLEKVWRDV